ncbi:MAG: hypothetical protein JSS83_07980 [Cyanobacteria bacterium SZAS LIN-3]|nr:hypothetical protein [Cyanobacteria bacterium SZAS LIN-3]
MFNRPGNPFSIRFAQMAFAFIACVSLPAWCLPTVTGAPVEDKPADSSAPAPATPAAEAAPTTTPANSALTGSVATSEQNAESVLNELEQTVHHLKDASWATYCEAQRPDVIYVGGPNIVGNVVINPIEGSGMINTGGFLPPRKKWIDFYAMHVAYLAPILKGELALFKLPDGASSDTLEDYEEYNKLANRLPELCDKMLEACKGPKYDNVNITMAAGMLNEELKRYDKVRKELYKDIQEEHKKEVREEKLEDKSKKQ